MIERPMLFSAPMVRGLLNDTKTQTRRVAKLTANGHVKEPSGNRRWHTADFDARLACPYGQPSDRLWVRETYGYRGGCISSNPQTALVDYIADKATATIELAAGAATPIHRRPKPNEERHDYEAYLHRFWTRSIPAIHMPRWASRIMLEITRVRVERLQDLTAVDAIAEGIESLTYGGQTSYRDYSLSDEWAEVSPMLESPIESYCTLWESINGPGSWDANPWVWVVDFKRMKGETP